MKNERPHIRFPLQLLYQVAFPFQQIYYKIWQVMCDLLQSTLQLRSIFKNLGIFFIGTNMNHYESLGCLDSPYSPKLFVWFLSILCECMTHEQ